MKTTLIATIDFRAAFEAGMKTECGRCIYCAFDECHFDAPTDKGFPSVEPRDFCRHFETRADVLEDEGDEV